MIKEVSWIVVVELFVESFVLEVEVDEGGIVGAFVSVVMLFDDVSGSFVVLVEAVLISISDVVDVDLAIAVFDEGDELRRHVVSLFDGRRCCRSDGIRKDGAALYERSLGDGDDWDVMGT